MSGSVEGRPGWRAGARVYSGREDPSWPVDEVVVESLRALWNSLPLAPASVRAGRPAVLGYRGCWLASELAGTWSAADGWATHAVRGCTEARLDDERRFESALLATAPEGMLPDPLP